MTIRGAKYSLQMVILPLYSALPHQAHELSLLRGLKRVFLSPGVTTFGGALLLGFGKCPRSIS
jgi:hypothetical protein